MFTKVWRDDAFGEYAPFAYGEFLAREDFPILSTLSISISLSIRLHFCKQWAWIELLHCKTLNSKPLGELPTIFRLHQSSFSRIDAYPSCSLCSSPLSPYLSRLPFRFSICSALNFTKEIWFWFFSVLPIQSGRGRNWTSFRCLWKISLQSELPAQWRKSVIVFIRIAQYIVG